MSTEAEDSNRRFWRKMLKTPFTNFLQDCPSACCRLLRASLATSGRWSTKKAQADACTKVLRFEQKLLKTLLRLTERNQQSFETKDVQSSVDLRFSPVYFV